MSARLWCYQKQIAHMREELFLLEQQETNRQLTSYCPVGNTEDVILSINRLITKYSEELVRLKRENQIYRESITSISHDIRTPLTSGKGYLQMLQKGGISEEKQKEYIGIVEKRLVHLTDMLNQLFEYARIEAGELSFSMEEINAGNLFAETIALFYEDFVRNNCEPEVHVTEKVCKIMADKNAYVRIIENLMKNALVHGKGGYRLEFFEKNGCCIIRVSNLTDSVETGEIERVFDRFYTTDRSRTKKTTGLGLAIVKRFSEQMGGTAKAELSGDRFAITVSFPLL